MLGIITRPIGCLLSFIGGLVLIIVLLIGGTAWLIKTKAVPLFASEVESFTGYGISIREHELSFLDTSVEISDMAITNPATDFATTDFLVVRRFFVGLDVESSHRNTLYLSDMEIDIQRLTWVKNENSKINLEHFFSNLLAEFVKQWERREQPDSQVNRVVVRNLEFRLDRLKLVAPGVAEQVYDVNLSYQFNDVSSLAGLLDALASDLRRRGVPVVADSVEATFQISP